MTDYFERTEQWITKILNETKRKGKHIKTCQHLRWQTIYVNVGGGICGGDYSYEEMNYRIIEDGEKLFFCANCALALGVFSKRQENKWKGDLNYENSET
jgi:hypothetical protein